MKKLLMIIGAALLMSACCGNKCEKEDVCCKEGDKKECTKGDKKECHKDAAHGEHHKGHGEKEDTCEPGCTKACCSKPLLDSNNNPVLDENGKEVMVNKAGDVITEEFIIEDAVEVVTEH